MYSNPEILTRALEQLEDVAHELYIACAECEERGFPEDPLRHIAFLRAQQAERFVQQVRMGVIR